jgi:prophage regulatory protein
MATELHQVLPDEALVALPQVKSLVSLSGSGIYKRISEGRFPRPLKLAPFTSRWRMADVRRWLADPIGYRSEGEKAQ